MPTTTPTSIRIREDLRGRLKDIAKLSDRPVSWIINQAIKEFIAKLDKVKKKP